MGLMWEGPCLFAWLMFAYYISVWFRLDGISGLPEEQQEDDGEKTYGFIDSAMFQDME